MKTVPEVGDEVYVDRYMNFSGGLGKVNYVTMHGGEHYIGLEEYGSPSAIMRRWADLESKQEKLRKKFGKTRTKTT